MTISKVESKEKDVLTSWDTCVVKLHVKVVGQPHTSLSFREIPTRLTAIRGKLGAGCKYSIFPVPTR